MSRSVSIFPEVSVSSVRESENQVVSCAITVIGFLILIILKDYSGRFHYWLIFHCQFISVNCQFNSLLALFDICDRLSAVLEINTERFQKQVMSENLQTGN